MWWLIIRTPDGVRCWPAGDDQAAHGQLVAAGRLLAGVPADDSWVASGSDWDVQLAQGEPRAELLERATVGTPRELQVVDVTAYEAQRARAAQTQRADVVADMLTGLDDAALSEMLARPEVAVRVRPASAAGLDSIDNP